MSITWSDNTEDIVESMDESQMAEFLGRTGELARVVVRHLDRTADSDPAENVARLRGLLTKYVTRGTPLA